jgi:hypothetical protein
MSNSKNAIGEIKKLMVQFGFLTEEKTPLSFKLSDNTILQTSKLEAGSKISKINEEFETVNLEDGIYKTVEHFEIEVKNGEIKSVKEIFVDAKLTDGTEIKVSGTDLVEGAKVVVKTGDSEVPAPDGTHELKDGSSIETKGGIITKVVDAPANEDDENNETPEAPQDENPMGKEQMDEMYNMMKDFVTKAHDKIMKMEEQMSSLQNEFNSFKKEPAAKKIADGKTNSFSKENNEDHLDARIKALESLRNK